MAHGATSCQRDRDIAPALGPSYPMRTFAKRPAPPKCTLERFDSSFYGKSSPRVNSR
ncbi:hypothetical protein COLSTE_00747 [Collinsella stercoris DSM 13279]|uniref:Uncharacterized protein n=1 Tax=Collinsella stercoris DSM 13279 TaxID=445975 RepID=B6G9K6_9ACTN|nr:hypothetical protein COLSTE_00747 [Collinsella stercoris DSM 13279]